MRTNGRFQQHVRLLNAFSHRATYFFLQSLPRGLPRGQEAPGSDALHGLKGCSQSGTWPAQSKSTSQPRLRKEASPLSFSKETGQEAQRRILNKNHHIRLSPMTSLKLCHQLFSFTEMHRTPLKQGQPLPHSQRGREVQFGSFGETLGLLWGKTQKPAISHVQKQLMFHATT